MLLTRQKQEPAPPQLNMASMVDVVFLLLIFFMCTSSFTQIEDKLLTQLSQIGSGTSEESMDFPPIRISLQGSPGNLLVIYNGEPYYNFQSLLEKLRNDRIGDDVSVIIEGQGTVSYDSMVKALDCCYLANIQHVAFSTRGDTI
jgi:biopolymer transport protein ExbD